MVGQIARKMASPQDVSPFSPTIVPSNFDLTIFPRLIEHIAEFRVLYYYYCKQVCFSSSLNRHLADFHKIPIALRRPIVRFCLTLDFIDATIDLAL